MARHAAPRNVVASPTGFTSIDLRWEVPVGTIDSPYLRWGNGLLLRWGNRIRLRWPETPISPITGYQYRIDDGPWQDAGDADARWIRIRGLTIGTNYRFYVRAVASGENGGESAPVMAAPQRVVIGRTLINPPRFNLQNTDRQSFIVQLSGFNCRLIVWWQESDQSWYGSIEIPVGNPFVSGRRLLTDTALLSRVYNPLAGDIWCRALDDTDRHIEPGKAPWGRTHALFWEIPALG